MVESQRDGEFDYVRQHDYAVTISCNWSQNVGVSRRAYTTTTTFKNIPELRGHLTSLQMNYNPTPKIENGSASTWLKNPPLGGGRLEIRSQSQCQVFRFTINHKGQIRNLNGDDGLLGSFLVRVGFAQLVDGLYYAKDCRIEESLTEGTFDEISVEEIEIITALPP